jgi:hypothetical protein
MWDRAQFLCDSYQLQIDRTTEPILAFEVDLDENQQETAWRIEWGEPRRTETQLIAGLSERIYWLEHPNS